MLNADGHACRGGVTVWQEGMLPNVFVSWPGRTALQEHLSLQGVRGAKMNEAPENSLHTQQMAQHRGGTRGLGEGVCAWVCVCLTQRERGSAVLEEGGVFAVHTVVEFNYQGAADGLGTHQMRINQPYVSLDISLLFSSSLGHTYHPKWTIIRDFVIYLFLHGGI